MYDKDKLSRIVEEPGVYLMKDRQGCVLYVGKAKRLKTRLKQYFAKSGDEREMIPFLIAKVDSIETIVTLSEKEALLLENSLIKQHKPQYNVLLKDDKTFISLMINTRHKWPMIRLVRTKGRHKKDGIYFGPYTSAFAARRTLDIMHKAFPLRQCSDGELKRRERPCLLYGIKQCIAPCIDKCTKETYDAHVQDAIDFLKGKNSTLLDNLTQEMEKASEQLEFERAGELLQTINQIKQITEGKALSATIPEGNCDALGLHREGAHLFIVQILVRNGQIVGKEPYHFSNVAGTDNDILESFLLQHFAENQHKPKEIFLPIPLENHQILQELLHIKLTTPLKGSKKKLIDLAKKNASAECKQQLSEATMRLERLGHLKETLSLNTLPYRIECFDTSNIAGTDPVAALVAFTDGAKDKKRTRLYKIRGAGDDISAMREVLTRRYTKARDEGDLPDLIIIDGGKGQLSTLSTVLSELNIATPDIVAITKEAGRHDKGLTKERLFLPHKKEPISLKAHDPLLFFLQEVRDEAHRVAIAFHKKRRTKRIIKSELDQIPGIGPQKKKALLQHFKSVKRIKEATTAELTSLPSITKRDAQRINDYFSKNGAQNSNAP